MENNTPHNKENLPKFGKNSIERLFRGRNKNNILQKYSRQISEFENYELEFICYDFIWAKQFDLFLETKGKFRSKYMERFSASGKLFFTSNTTGIKVEKNYTFNLIGIVYFNEGDDLITYNVIDDNELIIERHYLLISKELDNLELNGFLGEETIHYNGRRLLEFYLEICRKHYPKNFIKDDLNTFYEFARIIQNIRYTISQLSIYHPYTKNLGEDSIIHNGKIIYRYFPTFIDRMYFSMIDQIFILFVSFWDRIAHILVPHFPLKTNVKVHFTTVFEEVKKCNDLKNSLHFKWFINFRYSSFKKFNSLRNKVIHNKVNETEFFEAYISSEHKPEGIKKLQSEKVQLFQQLIDFYNCSTEGFIQTILLLDEIVTIRINREAEIKSTPPSSS